MANVYDAGTLTLPFIGRQREIERLRRLHSQGNPVLILGPPGVGKSALVSHLRELLGLRVCPNSERLSDICEALERELQLESAELRLIPRKNRILQALEPTTQVVVFDGASWTTPKIASFIECASRRTPVWLCVRSEHPWEVGRIWPLLVRFARVELKPFQPRETLLLVEAAARAGRVPAEALKIVEWLHRRAAGNPKVLCELLAEIARGHYDLSQPLALRRLELDRRIHEVFPI
jgi:AAA ATPase domain